VTRITLTDPVLIDQVQHAEAVEFRDPSGRVLAKFSAAPTTDALPPERPAYTRADVREFREQLERFIAQRPNSPPDSLPDDLCRLPPGFKSPITEEERRENRKQTDGKPLLEGLRDLEESL
jgi:cytochrome P450